MFYMMVEKAHLKLDKTPSSNHIQDIKKTFPFRLLPSHFCFKLSTKANYLSLTQVITLIASFMSPSSFLQISLMHLSKSLYFYYGCSKIKGAKNYSYNYPHLRSHNSWNYSCLVSRLVKNCFQQEGKMSSWIIVYFSTQS